MKILFISVVGLRDSMKEIRTQEHMVDHGSTMTCQGEIKAINGSVVMAASTNIWWSTRLAAGSEKGPKPG